MNGELRQPRIRGLAAILWIMLAVGYPLKASPSNEVVRLVADPARVVLELRTTAWDLQDLRISAPGLSPLSEPGRPVLPVKGVVLAAPPGARIELHVQTEGTTVHPGVDLDPAPTPHLEPGWNGSMKVRERVQPDPRIYGADAFYPMNPAWVGWEGILRDQRLVQITVCPFQYNPATRVLRIYRSVRVEVRFTGWRSKSVSTRENTRFQNPTFDRLVRTLVVNPEEAGHDAFPSAVRQSKPALDPDLTWYKITVDQDGLYRIDRGALPDAGMEVSSVDPRNWSLFYKGEEIAITVQGEEDGVFDEGDGIEFYGMRNRGPFSNDTVYWLTVGKKPGRRMSQRPSWAPEGMEPKRFFFSTAHFEENHYYHTSIPDGEGADHWFWLSITAPDTLTVPFTLFGIAEASEQALLRVHFRGVSYPSLSPDHHLRLSLNGHPVAEALWDGQAAYTVEAAFPVSLLLEGRNHLTIEAPLDLGAKIDISYLDWIEVGYPHRYQAQDGALYFSEEPGDPWIALHGFEEPEIRVFDLTDSTAVAEVLPFETIEEQGSFGVRFRDPRDRPTRYVGLEPSTFKTPKSIVRDTPSDLHAEDNGADYLVITHEKFYKSILPLAAFREAQGLRVRVVRIGDVYDEFSDGLFDPGAIRAFIRYAFEHWSPPAPTHVLLVGDATYDYKDYEQTGKVNYVPTHLFQSVAYSTETASDNWFVDVHGDDHLPDLFIGRLSAKTERDVTAAVHKILHYEGEEALGQAWQNRILLSADRDSTFEAISDQLGRMAVGAGLDLRKVYLRDFPDGAAGRKKLLADLNAGALLLTYTGHGAIDTWSKEDLLTSSQISLLSNGDRLPLVVVLNCLSGFFHHVDIDYSLSEEFLRAENKGAVACWSPSGFGFPWAHALLARHLFSILLEDQEVLLGAALARTKIATLTERPGAWDHIEMYNLLGDPALKIALPPRPDLMVSDRDIRLSPDPPKPGQPVTISAVIHNRGRAPAENVGVQVALQPPDRGNIVLLHEARIPYLSPGASTEVQTTWTGSSPGSQIVWVYLDKDSTLVESNEHNNVIGKPLIIPSVEPPEVTLALDGLIVGETFQDGDFVSSSPTLCLKVRRHETVQGEHVVVQLDGQPLLDVPFPGEESPEAFEWEQPLSDLSPGIHQVDLMLSSSAYPWTQTVTFRVAAHLSVLHPLVYPNPVREEGATFFYTLSKRADRGVTIRIYGLSGRLITVLSDAQGNLGLNAVPWDGKDSKGRTLANGTYLFKVVARGHAGYAEALGNIAVVR